MKFRDEGKWEMSIKEMYAMYGYTSTLKILISRLALGSLTWSEYMQNVELLMQVVSN